MNTSYKILLVTLMLSFISKALGMGASPETTLAHPRHIDLGGNHFQFAMPEDFSRDMPAKPLVTSFDINNPSRFEQPQAGGLMQRWWDIKEAGFFGKALGTVMMSISVHQRPQNTRQLLNDKPYDLSDRLGFMLALDQTLYNNYRKDSSNTDPDLYYNFISFASVFGFKIEAGYRDVIINGQKWMGYSVTGPESLLIVSYAAPINQDNFLEVSFSFAPNHDIHPRTFREVASKKTELIEQSMRLRYNDGNLFAALVNKHWLEHTNDEVMQMRQAEIIPPIFGDELYQQILKENGQVIN